MKNYLSLLTDQKAKAFTANFVEFFEKLPHLPAKFRQIIIKLLPYLALIAGVANILNALQDFARPQRLNHWLNFYTNINPLYYYLSALISLVMAVLFLQAYQLLSKKKAEGWLLIFWTTVLNLLQSLVAVIFAWGGVFGTLFWSFIGFYLIYEVRATYFKNKSSLKKAAPAKKTSKKSPEKKSSQKK